MKPFVHRFDVVATKLVARISNKFIQPFHYLGYMTMPAAWFGYISLFLIVTHVSNQSSLKFGLACLLLLPVATFIKFVFKRQRPGTIYAGSMRVKSYSFPSSHAYSAVIGSGYFAMQAALAQMWWFVGLLTLLVLVVGTSRVRLGAHYPSDVTAGWLLGVVLLCTASRLF